MSSITDLFGKASNGTAPVATTLASQKVNGATSASLSLATGWPTTTPVHGVLYKVNASNVLIAGTVLVFKALLSGTTLSSFTVKSGTDDVYAAGSVIQLQPTSAWADDLITGILVDHDQNGYHKDLHGSNAHVVWGLTDVASAVNNFRATNAITGGAPSILVEGSDTNIDGLFGGKGTGSGRWNGYHDGWILANEVPTFASSTTINVAAGTKYQVGDLIQLTQSATQKYFVVTGIASNILTVSGFAGATVANSVISGFYYSREALPTGLGVKGIQTWNPYKFSVYRNAARSITAATFTNILPDTKLFDTGGNVDIVTNVGRFTAPVAGFYHFSGSLYNNTGFGAGANHIMIAMLYKNGSPAMTGSTAPLWVQPATSSVSGVLQLAAGDYVELFGYCDVGPCTLTVTLAYANNLTGFLISAI